MTGSTWTTPSQAAFLAERNHIYLEHKEKKTIAAAWSKIIPLFFIQWPNQDAEIKEDIASSGPSNVQPSAEEGGADTTAKKKNNSTRKLFDTHEAWKKTRTAVRLLVL